MLDCPTTCFLFIRWKDFYWDSCWDNIPPLLVHQPWCCWPFGSGDIAVNRGPHLSSWRVSEDTWGCLSTSSWRKLVLLWRVASLHSLPNSSFSCHSNCVTLATCQTPLVNKQKTNLRRSTSFGNSLVSMLSKSLTIAGFVYQNNSKTSTTILKVNLACCI